jgi:acrylyl-CoA reductase (NADPH)
MPSFRAFRIINDDGRIRGTFTDVTLDELTPGDVVIRAAYSSVNFKDALAATGSGKILKRFPLIGGIDVAGVVESSADGRFQAGQRVLVTGYDLGVAQDGGYAEFVRVPGDWVVPLPDGLTPIEAMAFGTAGFTAGLSVLRLEQMGLRPGHGPIAVTGATGGVGSIAIGCLARRGYEVTAITGKASEREYLLGLGARDVLDRGSLQLGTRPLEKAMWAGAIDAVGGELLAWLTRTTNYWGAIASCGLAGGTDLHTTVMPFILRGVSLIGIDSVACPMNVRREVWQRLATDLKPEGLSRIAREIPLEGLPDAFTTLLNGAMRGRYVVRLSRD